MADRVYMSEELRDVVDADDGAEGAQEPVQVDPAAGTGLNCRFVRSGKRSKPFDVESVSHLTENYEPVTVVEAVLPTQVTLKVLQEAPDGLELFVDGTKFLSLEGEKTIDVIRSNPGMLRLRLKFRE